MQQKVEKAQNLCARANISFFISQSDLSFENEVVLGVLYKYGFGENLFLTPGKSKATKYKLDSTIPPTSGRS